MTELILALTFVVTLSAFAALWAVHVVKKDVGVVDIYWGPGFAVIGLIALFTHVDASREQWILLTLTALWAVRLGVYLAIRHHHSTNEDRRYAQMRANGGSTFWWVSLFKIFLLQGILMWLIATPQHVGLLNEDPNSDHLIVALFWAGCALFWVGFLFEVVADWQLYHFKRDASNIDQTMTTGIWAYSRHPNYFGEIVLWWGMGMMAFAISGSFISFIGPALLHLLILKVSGVSMLEQHLGSSKPDYAAYIKNTSRLIPKFPRSK